eukprot:m.207213 g.207213  ORF g.207213 m.207213 type:complete len:283 (-) comp10125_c2_seq15:166-1014(-)
MCAALSTMVDLFLICVVVVALFILFRSGAPPWSKAVLVIICAIWLIQPADIARLQEVREKELEDFTLHINALLRAMHARGAINDQIKQAGNRAVDDFESSIKDGLRKIIAIKQTLQHFMDAFDGGIYQGDDWKAFKDGLADEASKIIDMLQKLSAEQKAAATELRQIINNLPMTPAEKTAFTISPIKLRVSSFQNVVTWLVGQAIPVGVDAEVIVIEVDVMRSFAEILRLVSRNSPEQELAKSLDRELSTLEAHLKDIDRAFHAPIESLLDLLRDLMGLRIS